MTDHDYTVLVDDREKKPLPFSRFPDVATESRRLKTGDYCVKGDGTQGGEHFYPEFAVERKAASDFINSISWERDRFENELDRAGSFTSRMPVIVAKPLRHFKEGQYYADVHPNSVIGTVDQHPERYNMDYFFARDRQHLEVLTKEWLDWRFGQLEHY